MNEYLLINMLSEVSPELLKDNYMENDLRKKAPPFWKRVLSFVKHKEEPKDFIEPFVITNIEEQFQEHTETVAETDSEDEYTIQEEEPLERNFSISIFKKKMNMLFTIISGIIATIIFIIGVVIFIIRRARNLKINNKKMQISF